MDTRTVKASHDDKINSRSSYVPKTLSVADVGGSMGGGDFLLSAVGGHCIHDEGEADRF